MSFIKVVKAPITQLLQFSIIGIMNAIIDIGAFNAFLFIDPTTSENQLLLYNSVAYVMAVINSYIWNSRITFSRNAVRTKKEIMLFVIQAGISLGISNGVFLLFFRNPGFWQIPVLLFQNISKTAAMFLSSTTSFLLMKYVVFRRKKYQLP